MVNLWNKYFKNGLIGLVVALTLALTAISCGNDSSIRAVIDGRQIDLPIDGVEIFSDGFANSLVGPNGQAISGYNLSILIRFINGNTVDQLTFSILDASVLVPGIQHIVDQNNIIATLSLQNVNQFVGAGQGALIFDEIGIAQGQKVRGRFQLTSPAAVMEGEFVGSVQPIYY